MNSKTKKIVNAVATVVPAALVIMSGIFKLTGSRQVVEKLQSVGVGPYIPILGVMEIGFALLFIFPGTMRIGFIFLSCYFAGAIATDLSHGMTILNAAFPMVLVWIGTFIRDRKSFFSSENQLKVQSA
ncbi:MAG TPA: DoxX family protein [Puia sp.]|nr:DoxX family protein [Puia sp.]